MLSGKPIKRAICENQLANLSNLCKICATVSIATYIWSKAWLKKQWMKSSCCYQKSSLLKIKTETNARNTNLRKIWIPKNFVLWLQFRDMVGIFCDLCDRVLYRMLLLFQHIVMTFLKRTDLENLPQEQREGYYVLWWADNNR